MSILGVNEVGQERDNALMVDGRDLPWLQDTAEVQVWREWPIVYRDVVVLDGQGEHLFTFNLTEHDLNEDADYQALSEQLRDAVP